MKQLLLTAILWAVFLEAAHSQSDEVTQLQHYNPKRLPASLEIGLVVHYPLDGSMLDASGNANNLVGNEVSPAADRFGNPSGAYEFSTAWSYMASERNIGIMNYANRSISVWFKTPLSHVSLCGWGRTDDWGGLSFLKLYGAQLVFNGHYQDFWSTHRLLPDVWTHACITYGNRKGEVYINGTLDASATVDNLSTIPTRLNVGYDFGGTGPTDWNVTFRGLIDDIRVYDRVLSATEVRALAFEGVATGIMLFTPNGNERFATGSRHFIRWAAWADTFVDIDYSTDNGSSWAPIASHIPADTGSFMWVVPATPSTQCEVRVSYAGSTELSASSSQPFTIYTPLHDTTIEEIITEVNIDSLMYSVRVLSGEVETQIGGSTTRITTREGGTGGNDLAKLYLADRLRSYGLDVELHDYDQSRPGATNVVGTQQGASPTAPAVLLCAHLDDASDGETAPGADDNASGTAAVLEAARILSQYSTKATVIYAFWNEEEWGTIGSGFYAQRSAQRGDSIIGVINLDMIGWDGDDDGESEIHTDSISGSLAIADSMVSISEKYGLSIAPVVYTPGTSYSDHYAFWYFGYSAVLFIEAYYGDDFNEYYHTTSDRIQNFNVGFFENSSKLAIGTLAALAGIVSPTSVAETDGIPMQMGLSQNFPNPFNPTTAIEYSLPDAGYVTVKVYNVLGEEVAVLVAGNHAPGTYTVKWDASRIPSGVYFYRLTAGEVVQTKKMVLMR